jgi:hypothetical protein
LLRESTCPARESKMLIVAPDDWIRPVTAVDTQIPSSGLSIFVRRLRKPLCDLMNLERE